MFLGETIHSYSYIRLTLELESVMCTESVKNQRAHVFWGNNTFLQLHSVVYDIIL